MSKTYTTLSREGYTYLIGLIRNLANVSEGIDDLHLLSNGTFSSVKIDTLLNTLRSDCNEYTDRLVANLSRLELKIANDESEISQPNFMYLYKPSGATSYEQYVVIEGTKILLGTCDIDMGDYYTITQADARFVLKTDFESLKTKVDEKVDKTNIITAKNSGATDDQVYSAKAVNTELDGVVKKADISTIIDGTSTNDTIPTNKAVYDSLINKLDKTIILNTADEVNSFDKAYQSFMIRPDVADALGLPSSPSSAWFCIHFSHVKGHKYPSQIAFEYAGLDRIMYRTAHKGVWITWRELCTTTSVADVGKTDITSSVLNATVNSGGGVYYSVKNGICYLQIHSVNILETSSGKQILSSGSLPMIDMDLSNGHYTLASPNSTNGLIVVSADGFAYYYGKEMTVFTTISYPVKES